MANNVVEIGLPWEMEPGATYPSLKQDSFEPLGVSYYGANTDCTKRVVLRSNACEQFVFGYPNDEALPTHPLYQFGLGYYGLFEVVESDWGDRLAMQNLLRFPSTDLQAFQAPAFHCHIPRRDS
jgi:hypothetical protein